MYSFERPNNDIIKKKMYDRFQKNNYTAQLFLTFIIIAKFIQRQISILE